MPGNASVTGPAENTMEWKADLVGPCRQAKKRALMLIMDKLTLEDLLSCRGPALTSLLERGAISLMNTNTATLPGTEGGYLSLGSGARLLGNWSVRLAFNRDEYWQGGTAEGLYLLLSGADLVPPGAIIHPYWRKLQELNEGRPYPARIGVLGETLKVNGFNAAVVGNADSFTPGRQAASIAMDSLGVVAYGDVSKALLQQDEGFPFGVRSDHRAYLQAVRDIWDCCSLFVIDWGDSSRIDAYLEHLSRERREQLLKVSFAEFDQFLYGIIPCLDENTRLFLLSPSPPQNFSSGQRMTPLLYYDPSSGEKGLLSSASTRRAGIVTNIDIVPTILDFLGLSAPVFLFGAPLEIIPVTDHRTKLAEISMQTASIYQQRPAVIKGFILTVIIAILLVGIAVTTRVKRLYFLRYFLCALLNFPAALLLVSAVPFSPTADIFHTVLLVLFVAFPLTVPALLLVRSNPLASFAYSGLSISALLIFDLCLGAPLNSRSLLGYDPIGGARFYGIGNEYMGVLIGSFILGFFSFFSLFRYRALPQTLSHNHILNIPPFAAVLFSAISMLIVFFMASPKYGANFGGAVTAGIAFPVAMGILPLITGEKGKKILPYLFPGKTGYNIISLLVIFLTVTIFLIYSLNTTESGAPVSHLGKTWELVRSDGLVELGKVALRKGEMNLKLVRYSLWSRVLLGFIALLSVLYIYPVGFMHSIFKREPVFKAVFGGIILGSAVAFCINDSGVVAAATLMLYGGLPLLILSLREVFLWEDR